MESLDLLTNECINLLHRNKLLKPLIRSELTKSILSKVHIDDEINKKVITEFKAKAGITEAIDFEKWLVKNEISNSEFEEIALTDTRLKIYCEKEYTHNVEAHFLERKNQLELIVYSLFRIKNFYKSREMFLRIHDKEADFGDLAALYSEGPEKSSRGIIGPVPLEQAHPLLIDKLRTSKVGEVQTPVPIDGSYIIIRVEAREPAILEGLIRQEMLFELFNKWMDGQVNEYNMVLINKFKNHQLPLEVQKT